MNGKKKTYNLPVAVHQIGLALMLSSVSVALLIGRQCNRSMWHSIYRKNKLYYVASACGPSTIVPTRKYCWPCLHSHAKSTDSAVNVFMFLLLSLFFFSVHLTRATILLSMRLRMYFFRENVLFFFSKNFFSQVRQFNQCAWIIVFFLFCLFLFCFISCAPHNCRSWISSRFILFFMNMRNVVKIMIATKMITTM